MPTLRTDTPLFEALGAKNVFLRRLEKLGVKTIGDLLRHFPVRYEDFSTVSPIAELAVGQETTVRGVVRDVQVKHAWRRNMPVTEALIEDESGTMRAVWFNQPYVANTLRVGRMANFAGKILLAQEGDLYFNHPSYELVRASATAADQAMTHTARLVPIYPETKGLTSRGLRFIMSNILKRRVLMIEWIPQNILSRHDLPSIPHAFAVVHFPQTIEEASAARRRFSFEDLFLLQILNLRQKHALAEQKAPAIPEDVDRIKAILVELPFELTATQKRSLWEIVKDMAQPRPMNRLLQGDVGSGKTIVAAIAGMMAAAHAYQTAFMAPTEILARQHFETMKKLLKNLKIEKPLTIGLITASEAIIFYENDLAGKLKKDEFWKKAAAGEIDIVFGTHALIQTAAQFHKLGLVIVDEQHRFGVRQRQALIHGQSMIPHFLSMSATPIPRTLMMTVFGDLDVSLITELPAGRKPIETKIIAPNERASTYEFIRAQVGEGRQVFVICPRIEEEDKEPTAHDKRHVVEDLKSVTQEYEKLSKEIFPELRVAMLHGRMKAKEKEDVMRSFKEGAIDILVSTSVVEVGVDIPNASIMMIESAERFGLAQLYQFRGRVGRGEHASYCFLLTESDGTMAKARLTAIVSAKNGFELAEKDLQLRGPGQFFGAAQSGFSDMALEALRDPELVKISRDSAVELLTADPKLSKNTPLRERLEEFQKRVHQE